MTLKFRFDENKAVAALGFVASESPGLTLFFVSKVLFYADKWHINRFGRPVIGDEYIRMKDGPVPSTVKDYIDEKWDRVAKPHDFENVIQIKHGLWLRWLYAGRNRANLDLLSQTDMHCLREAIAFCKDKSKEELSALSHEEKAWKRASNNREMDYEDFVDDDNPHQAEMVTILKETAACGVM